MKKSDCNSQAKHKNQPLTAPGLSHCTVLKFHFHYNSITYPSLFVTKILSCAACFPPSPCYTSKKIYYCSCFLKNLIKLSKKEPSRTAL